MDIYKSARLITTSQLLQKNKGIMVLGDVAGVTLTFNGISAGNWVTTRSSLHTAANSVNIIPTSIYGITLGTGSGKIFEIN